MTILNVASDGLLSVFLSLHGTLSVFGTVTRERLLTICAPSTVVPAGKPQKARQTLTRWVQLGAFVEKEGHIRLAPEFRVAPGDLDGLRREVLRTLLRFDNSPFLDSKDALESGDDDDSLDADVETDADEESDEARKSGCSDFTRASAWAMLQDPYLFDPTKVIQQQNQQGLKPRAIRNTSRWSGFEMWSLFTGVTVQTPGRLVLNPALAIRLALDEIFPSDTRLSLDAFVARVSDRLPFLDGGRYQQAILERTTVPRPEKREISRALSIAILQLQAEGLLKLLDVSDADRRILLGRGPQSSAYTHVEWRKG
jgi:hypothetical protein